MNDFKSRRSSSNSPLWLYAMTQSCPTPSLLLNLGLTQSLFPHPPLPSPVVPLKALCLTLSLHHNRRPQRHRSMPQDKIIRHLSSAVPLHQLQAHQAYQGHQVPLHRRPHPQIVQSSTVSSKPFTTRRPPAAPTFLGHRAMSMIKSFRHSSDSNAAVSHCSPRLSVKGSDTHIWLRAQVHIYRNLANPSTLTHYKRAFNISAAPFLLYRPSSERALMRVILAPPFLSGRVSSPINRLSHSLSVRHKPRFPRPP